MIDYQGFRNYLERLGFANNGINTYVSSYLHENKIAILNNFDEYAYLNDEEKIIKLSKEDNSFKEQFDKHHIFSKDTTFSDVISGARRYVLFLQYKAIQDTLTKYKANEKLFVIHDAYWFFKVFDNIELYPVKAICRENLEILDLKTGYTTNDAKSRLTNIFNFKNNKNNLVFVDIRDKVSHDNKDKTMLNIKKQPLNQILYGPPGTGKTYNTIDRALQIIDGKVPESREEAKARFGVLKEAGQIEFVTFHQSYGYEEFVEGIKAKSEDNRITYTIESGIFKKISDKSLFYMTFTNYILNNFEKTIFGRLKIIDMENDEIYVDRSGEGTKEVLYLDKFFMIHESFDKFLYESKLKNPNKKINFHYKLYAEKILDDKKHDVWLYAKLYDSYISQKKLMTNIKQPRNYILIIDEINRGNISKIFGELITLIEESKRLGNEEAMEVTLPYSGEKFGVPKNLYIIGTMNTADRSIALMDTALRRRFEFEEMMPKPELLGDVEGIDMQQLLTKINQRIEYLYDRDHTIGHAYFLDLIDKPSLDSAMRNKVIPLLQEYFYDDWEKIQIVLGDSESQKVDDIDKFIVSQSIDENKVLGFNYEEMDESQKSYTVNTGFTNQAYKKIYE